ncbi:sensor histidine kinase [Kitasatospora sp. NPDC096147]|uniref:sensor histidine kinase n=1 Tax=Kitasatospora sp. NPDC096147 TaxID=3364093 RepID=UPI0037F95109
MAENPSTHLPDSGPAPDRGPGHRAVLLRQDGAVRWVVTSVVIVTAFLTTRPVGLEGRGLAVALLLVVCSLALLARHLPADCPPRITLPVLTCGVLASAALTGLISGGSGFLFAYFLAGHIGFRFPARQALVLAALTSLLCALALALGPGGDALPWAMGLTTGVPVVTGMLSRSRQRAVEAVVESAAAAERAARAEARTAVLTERSRIARDVHDVLAHSLAGINMQLELADALLETGDLAKVREANAKAHAMVRDSLRQAQWTVHALREDALPLVESLAAMAESSGHRDALVVRGTVREPAAKVTQQLLRIAQEALTNAARHAPGGGVAVELAFDGASVTLRVRNGPGRSAVPTEGSGMGLVGMRERVALLGGTLTTGPVTDGPDRGGWMVEAVIPG